LWLVSFNPPAFGTETLSDRILEKLNSGSRLQTMALALAQSARDVTSCLVQRNGWTREFGQKFPEPTPEALLLYLGIEHGNVRLDETNAHLIKNIFESTRSCIWLSFTLCGLLTEHGVKVRRRLLAEFGDGERPDVMKLSPLREIAALIPPDSEFDTWSAINFPAG